METLAAHYARLLGTEDSWRVEAVDLRLEDRRVQIRLKLVASGVTFFEHGADVFDLQRSRQVKAAESTKDARIAKLVAVVAQKEAKIARKNEVISKLYRGERPGKKASWEL